MKTTLNDNTLTLYLEGRIDTTNASRLDQEMTAIVEANPGASCKTR